MTHTLCLDMMFRSHITFQMVEPKEPSVCDISCYHFSQGAMIFLASNSKFVMETELCTDGG